MSKPFPPDVMQALRGRKALVTGGTGMIGSEVVRLLLDCECEVLSVSMDDLTQDSRARYLKGDLSQLEFCLDICNNVDLVFHVAGIKGSVIMTKQKPASFFVPLMMMNTNVLEAARRTNVSKLVYTSSIGAYAPAEVFREADDDFGKPPMDMFPGWAKRMAELQIEAYKIQYGMDNFSIVRPSNIYGPGDNFDESTAMVIPSLISRIVRGDNPVTIWGDGSSERDFLHATDAAIGVILACIRGTNSKPLNLGCGYGISIKQLVEILQVLNPFNAHFDLSKPSGFPKRIMDMNLAQSTIDFKPIIPIHDGLKQTLEWFKKNRTHHGKKINHLAS